MCQILFCFEAASCPSSFLGLDWSKNTAVRLYSLQRLLLLMFSGLAMTTSNLLGLLRFGVVWFPRHITRRLSPFRRRFSTSSAMAFAATETHHVNYLLISPSSLYIHFPLPANENLFNTNWRIGIFFR